MTNTHIALLIVFGLILLVWWWIRLMEEYQPKDVPSQYDDDDYRLHWHSEQYKTFLVYGHTNRGKSKIVEVAAVNGAEALEKARSENPTCKFNHVNVK